MSDEFWMNQALELASQAAALGEVPIGAVVVFEGQIVGSGYNRREIDRDPLAHAELLAIQEASKKLDRWRLTGCTLYVTLEPCTMCMGAVVNARLDRLVIGAQETKGRQNHFAKIDTGVLETECSEVLKAFFEQLRKAKQPTPPH